MSAAPVTLRVTRYRCAWCRRSFSAKARTLQHMTFCRFNPERRSCFTCKHAHDGYGEGILCALDVPFVLSKEDSAYPTAPYNVLCELWEASA